MCQIIFFLEYITDCIEIFPKEVTQTMIQKDKNLKRK
jgi:hypothetical protein